MYQPVTSETGRCSSGPGGRWGIVTSSASDGAPLAHLVSCLFFRLGVNKFSHFRQNYKPRVTYYVEPQAVHVHTLPYGT